MSNRLRKTIVCIIALFMLPVSLGCGEKKLTAESRELSFEDITSTKVSWAIETCRLIVEESGACIKGRVRNTGAFPSSGLSLYAQFLDSDGNVLVTGSCDMEYEEAVQPNGTDGYMIQIKNFFYPENIDSVTLEVGK